MKLIFYQPRCKEVISRRRDFQELVTCFPMAPQPSHRHQSHFNLFPSLSFPSCISYYSTLYACSLPLFWLTCNLSELTVLHLEALTLSTACLKQLGRTWNLTFFLALTLLFNKLLTYIPSPENDYQNHKLRKGTGKIYNRSFLCLRYI